MEIQINFGTNVQPTGVGQATPPKGVYKAKCLGFRQHKGKSGAAGLMVKYQIVEPATVDGKSVAGHTWEVWHSLPDGKNAEQDGYRVGDIKAMMIALAGEANRAKIVGMNGQSNFNFGQLIGKVAHMKVEPALDANGYDAITYISDAQYGEVTAGTLSLPDKAKPGKAKANGAAAPAAAAGGTTTTAASGGGSGDMLDLM